MCGTTRVRCTNECVCVCGGYFGYVEIEHTSEKYGMDIVRKISNRYRSFWSSCTHIYKRGCYCCCCFVSVICEREGSRERPCACFVYAKCNNNNKQTKICTCDDGQESHGFVVDVLFVAHALSAVIKTSVCRIASPKE